MLKLKIVHLFIYLCHILSQCLTLYPTEQPKKLTKPLDNNAHYFLQTN